MYDNKQLYYPNQPQQVTAVQPGILIAEPAPYILFSHYNFKKFRLLPNLIKLIVSTAAIL